MNLSDIQVETTLSIQESGVEHTNEVRMFLSPGKLSIVDGVLKMKLQPWSGEVFQPIEIQ
jgi:hypothetical protein